MIVRGNNVTVGTQELLGRAYSIHKREISSSVSHVYSSWSAA